MIPIGHLPYLFNILDTGLVDPHQASLVDALSLRFFMYRVIDGIINNL